MSKISFLQQQHSQEGPIRVHISRDIWSIAVVYFDGPSVYWYCDWPQLTTREILLSSPDGHSWWRHQMETFSALLALCAGNSPVSGEFPAQRPLTAELWNFNQNIVCEMAAILSMGRWINMKHGMHATHNIIFKADTIQNHQQIWQQD